MNDANRITFHPDDQIMEVDFSDLVFNKSGPVNDFYDEVDRLVTETGQKWYFLVNYRNLKIMLEASITFAHRGKKANIAYSLGSARYAVPEDVSESIKERAQFEHFDPNLFASRDTALNHLRELRAAQAPENFDDLKKLSPVAQERSYEDRITFHADLEIMEADFSDLSLERSRDVNAFYDILEKRLKESDRKWYFMVNYKNFKIEPEAWFAFTVRGKEVNLAYSMGSTRFDASQETAQSILDDAKREHFDANLLPSRDAAIQRITEMKSAQA